MFKFYLKDKWYFGNWRLSDVLATCPEFCIALATWTDSHS